MNRGPQPWQRFAEASRASGQEPRDESQASTPIPWLSGFPEQVHAMFLLLIWKRWTAAAILASLAVLAGLLLFPRPGTAEATPPAPRIPVPAAP